MNTDLLIKITQTLLLFSIVVLLVYAWLVVIPEQTELFEQCETKTLCENNILMGEICDKYEPDLLEEFNFSIPQELSELLETQ